MASEGLGLAMIWGGMMGIFVPVEYCLGFKGGPRLWRSSMDWFAARPQLTRTLSLAELGAGLWLTTLAARKRPPVRHLDPIS
jgi:hypothetical protein